MKVTPHKRHNPCPICESTSAKCRTTTEGLTLCMTSPDGAIAATGYRFIKPTANGLWGIYAPGDNRLSAAELESRRRARDAKLKREQSEHESGLGLADRDRAFRRLIEQLDLAPDHRANLQARGLTDAAIARGMFRSVEPGQTVEVNAKLPGARHGRFQVSGRGILCPAFDRLGRVVGAQIRRDEAEDGRYRWLRGDRSSHLQSGELPVTVAMPPGAPVAIAIIEGILKPFVAANLHGYACIGAAGGLFNSSPEQFRVAVDYLAKQLGTTEIHFPVDAGGRANEHVYKRDCETIRQLQRWGYRVKVGDWGQWDSKAAGDCAPQPTTHNPQPTTHNPQHGKAAGDWDEIAPDTPVAWRDARDYLPSRLDSLKAMLAKLGGALPSRPKPQGFAPVRYGEDVPPSPRVKVYAPGDRLSTWQQAGKFALDLSETGSGKSYDAGRLEGKAIYITTDPRNVTTETLRSWTVLEGKHAGLKLSTTGRLVRVRPREPYEIEPNCARVETIDALRDKAIAAADRASLICRTCPHFEPCKAGAVFGYLGARRDALQADRFVCHPNALPTLDQCDYGDRVLIWEEAASSFKPQRAFAASDEDLKDTIAALGLNAPAEFAKLQPWLAALYRLATADEQPRFGYSHNALRSRLPALPSDLDLEAIKMAIAPDLDSALSPYAADGVGAEDLAELRGHEDKSVRKSARRLMKTAKDAETAKRVRENVLSQWLLPALAVLRGETAGYLTLKYGCLTITQHDPRLLEIARAAKQNIFLDATWSAEELAALLGVDVEAIAALKAEQGEAATVRYVQVTGMKRLGMQRGKFQQQQAEAVLAELQRRHPDLVTVDFKKHARDGDLRWFSESRGVNDAENASAIALVGAPCPNLESLRADFTLTYGRVPGGEEDEEFAAYVDRRIDVEIEQGIGRLRANRRPGVELTVYLLGDRQPAFEVEQVAAAEITTEAMTKRERFAAAVKAAIAQLEAAGQAVNPSSVARLVNYHRQQVSRLWDWVQQTLIGDHKAKVAPPPADPDTVEAGAGVLAELAKNDSDDLLGAALEIFLDWLKPPDWRSCLELLPPEAQQAVLTCLLAAEPGG